MSLRAFNFLPYIKLLSYFCCNTSPLPYSFFNSFSSAIHSPLSLKILKMVKKSKNRQETSLLQGHVSGLLHKKIDQCLPTFKPHGLKKAKRDDVELTSKPLPQTISSLSRRRPATEEEKAKIRKAAESFTSKLPRFLKSLTVSHVYVGFVLNIPRNFARAHLLTRQKTKVTLRNTEGKAWRVNLFNYKERTVLCGGWPAFARANKLEEADVDIFELVGKFEMQVHIFRAIKEVKFASDDQI